MASLVITSIGDDRAGLVNALAGPIAEHGGNWERSHMVELAGKFAGVVLVTVPSASLDALIAALESVDASGLLRLRIERAGADNHASASTRVELNLLGQDHPGIIHEISHALAARSVSIDELETEVVPAPMSGHLFRARLLIGVPPGVSMDEIQNSLEDVADDLMVDVDVAD